MVAILSSSGTFTFVHVTFSVGNLLEKRQVHQFQDHAGKEKVEIKRKKNIVKGETVGDMTCNFHYHKTTQKKKKKN